VWFATQAGHYYHPEMFFSPSFIVELMITCGMSLFVVSHSKDGAHVYQTLVQFSLFASVLSPWFAI
jgi:hypothetical protein